MKNKLYVVGLLLNFISVTYAAHQPCKRLKPEIPVTFKNFTHEQRQAKRPEDFDRAKTLFINSFLKKGGTYEQWEDNFETGLVSPLLNYVEIFFENELAGIMFYQPGDAEGEVFLRDLAIALQHQKKGIGRRAINYVQSVCPGRTIWLFPMHKTEDFYVKMGFSTRPSGAFALPVQGGKGVWCVKH